MEHNKRVRKSSQSGGRWGSGARFFLPGDISDTLKVAIWYSTRLTNICPLQDVTWFGVTTCKVSNIMNVNPLARISVVNFFLQVQFSVLCWNNTVVCSGYVKAQKHLVRVRNRRLCLEQSQLDYYWLCPEISSMISSSLTPTNVEMLHQTSVTGLLAFLPITPPASPPHPDIKVRL